MQIRIDSGLRSRCTDLSRLSAQVASGLETLNTQARSANLGALPKQATEPPNELFGVLDQLAFQLEQNENAFTDLARRELTFVLSVVRELLDETSALLDRSRSSTAPPPLGEVLYRISSIAHIYDLPLRMILQFQELAP